LDKEKPLLRILDHVPVPALIASPLTGKILWTNDRIAAMYGVDSTDDVVGTNILDYVQPRQAGKALADLARVVAGQSPPPVTYELRTVKGDYAAGQVSSVPVVFRGFPAMLSFVTDVSERERTLRSLRESEERFRLLLNTMPSGVVVVVNDTIVFANQALATALGFDSPDELLEKSMYRFVDEAYRHTVNEARRRVVATGAHHPAAPVVLRRRDGSTIATTAATSLIHWEGDVATQTLLHDLGAPRAT
jgi:PAS domain S-box-containing protein